MKHVVAYQSPVVHEGLVYTPDWFAPGESTYGRLSKLIVANSSEVDYVCRAMFGASSSAKMNKDGLHSRSFLSSSWMRQNRAWHPEAAFFQESTLASVMRWPRQMGDSRLRFCSECVAVGFHSIACQVQGVPKCPVHQCRLVNQCPTCGEPTQPFAADPAIGRPFTCSACDRPYSQGWLGMQASERWELGLEYSQGYSDVVARLTDVWLDLQWPAIEEWKERPASSEECRRAGVLKALESINGAVVDRDQLDGPCRVYAVNRVKSSIVVYVEARRRLLKALRKHALKRFGLNGRSPKFFRRRFKLQKPDTWKSWQRKVEVISEEGTTPEMRGVLQWMLRFQMMPYDDDFVRRRHAIRPVRDLIEWPPYVPVVTLDWLRFVWESLMADIRFAREAAEFRKIGANEPEWPCSGAPPTLALVYKDPRFGDELDPFLIIGADDATPIAAAL